MSLQTKRAAGFIITIALAAALFFTLYQYDNKYTRPGIQAADGLFVLSEQDLAETPLRFLWHGWAFYPDVLLSPEDFQRGNPARYMEYLSIGQKVHFNSPANPKSAHGSGTYALRLRLPKETAIYALELPEVFSAYRLYLNGKMILQMGNPEIENYKPVTQNRTVTFNASGDVLLLVAVSDYSHFYSGMVYPPAFGTPEAVNGYTTGRMTADVALAVVALIVALLALYLGLRLKEKNTLIYALLCAAMLGSTCYTIFHTAFALPVFPWYGLEIASVYLVITLTVIVSNRICDVEAFTAKVSEISAGVFCLAALCYGLFAAILPLWLMQGFSTVIFLYKSAVAVYLIVTAWRSVKVQSSYGAPLLYAAVFFAAAIACDRFMPMYEPVTGGWFSEWGSIAMVFTAGYILWRDLVWSYSYSLAFAEEHRQVGRQLAMQVAYSKQLADRAEENRRIVHDFRQHIVTIDGIAEKANAGAVREYLSQVSQNLTAGMPHISFCKNLAVDALLRYYYALSKENDIEIRFDFSLPDSLPLTDVELCTVLGNLLENAVEACNRVTDGKRFIYLRSKNTGQMFFVLIENSFNGVVYKLGNKFLSGKADGREGVGLQSARKILESRGGSLIVNPRGNIFEIGISFPPVF